MNSSADASAETAPAKNPTRTILIVILILMIIALVYDKQVAQPTVKAAFDKVEAENIEINKSPDRKAMTCEDVQRVLGRAPSSVEKVNKYTVERYGFMRGLPVLQYSYYAVYTGGDDNLIFRTHALDLKELDLEDPNTKPRPSTSGEGAPAGESMDTAAGDRRAEEGIPSDGDDVEPAAEGTAETGDAPAGTNER